MKLAVMLFFIAIAIGLSGCNDGYSEVKTVQGKQGLKGDKGDKGDTGLTGATGPVGPRGLNGMNGYNGATGSVGPKGDTGPHGANAVIKQYLAPSSLCPNGGVVIDSFTDINNNGTYEAGIDLNFQRSVLCMMLKSSDDKEHSDKD